MKEKELSEEEKLERILNIAVSEVLGGIIEVVGVRENVKTKFIPLCRYLGPGICEIEIYEIDENEMFDTEEEAIEASKWWCK